MESVETHEIERAQFIAYEMNEAFDFARDTGHEDYREDLIELASVLAGVALLAGKEAPSEEESLKYSLLKAVNHYDRRDSSEVNLEIIEDAIDRNLEGDQRHYARFDADFEDQMVGEHRGKILSKAYWHIKFQDEVDKARRMGSDLSLIFIDFNFVKRVNDLYGHPEGDKLIRDIKTLFAMVGDEFRLNHNPGYPDRPVDLVAFGKKFNGSIPKEERKALLETGRLGGDEFASICYTDFAGATVIAERVRNMVEEHVNSPGNEHLKEIGLSAAIGVAALGENMTASDLLALADSRMYEDKERQKETRKPLLSEEQEAEVAEFEQRLARVGLKLEELPNYRRR
ncbi:MAG TPA: GGDEF domain-containing protein [Candidatus Saccharimonadales bacterium]|nr:GGDEF domain-containing protein [Candidatus Saccharimonadales bacterium]